MLSLTVFKIIHGKKNLHFLQRVVPPLQSEIRDEKNRNVLGLTYSNPTECFIIFLISAFDTFSYQTTLRRSMIRFFGFEKGYCTRDAANTAFQSRNDARLSLPWPQIPQYRARNAFSGRVTIISAVRYDLFGLPPRCREPRREITFREIPQTQRETRSEPWKFLGLSYTVSRPPPDRLTCFQLSGIITKSRSSRR